MRCILTPTKQTNPQALERVRALWQEGGVDGLSRWIHISTTRFGSRQSFAARGGFRPDDRLDRDPDGGWSLDLAGHSGGGLRDTTRIAAQLAGDVARYFSLESGECGGLYSSV